MKEKVLYMARTGLVFLIPLAFMQCKKEFTLASVPQRSKQQWIKDYFKELQSVDYANIYAVSWWHENFENSFLAINSSEAALHQYQLEVGNNRFIEQCTFVNGKLTVQTNKLYHAAFPNFGATEDIVSANRIDRKSVV